MGPGLGKTYRIVTSFDGSRCEREFGMEKCFASGLLNNTRLFYFILHLLIHEQARHALSSTNAHARQQDLLLGPSQLAQARDDLPHTRGTKRVTQGDGSAAGVHLERVEAQLVLTVDGHGGKGLVDLDHVDVVEGDVVRGQQLGDGDAGADAHDARGQARDGRADILCHDGLA